MTSTTVTPGTLRTPIVRSLQSYDRAKMAESVNPESNVEAIFYKLTSVLPDVY
jgi:hypothetical protein